MKTIITADTHFDSKTVMSMRPFDCVADHDEHILDQINRMAGRNDRLIVVGDFCSRSSKHILDRIICKNVYLVIGNHDRAQSVRAFKSAEESMKIKIRDLECYLNHRPWAYWDRSHRGSLHLYGHVHAEREETLDLAFPGRRSMDGGLDNAKRLLGELRPFTEDEIYDFLAPRPGHDHVEFYQHRRELRGEPADIHMGNFDG